MQIASEVLQVDCEFSQREMEWQTKGGVSVALAPAALAWILICAHI